MGGNNLAFVPRNPVNSERSLLPKNTDDGAVYLSHIEPKKWLYRWKDKG